MKNIYEVPTVFDFSSRDVKHMSHDELVDYISNHLSLLRAHLTCPELLKRIDLLVGPNVSELNMTALSFIESILFQIAVNLLICRGELSFIDGCWRMKDDAPEEEPHPCATQDWEAFHYSFGVSDNLKDTLS